MASHFQLSIVCNVTSYGCHLAKLQILSPFNLHKSFLQLPIQSRCFCLAYLQFVYILRNPMEAKDRVLLLIILLIYHVFSPFSTLFLLLGNFCMKITLYFLRNLSTPTLHFSKETHIPPTFSIPKHNDVEGEGTVSMINILRGSNDLFLELVG